MADNENISQPDEFLVNATKDSSEPNNPPVKPVEQVNSQGDNGKEPIVDPLNPIVDKVEPDLNKTKPIIDPKDITLSFKEHFADFDSVDTVKKLASRGTKYTEEVENELVQLRAQKTQLETEQKALKELRNKSPYKDERYYKLEKLAEESPDLVPVYQKLLFGNPDPLDIIKQDLILKHPEIFRDDPQSLERRLHREYPAIFDEDADRDSDEYKNAYTDMLMDSKIIKGELMKKINAIQVPDPAAINAEAEAKQIEFIKSWEPFAVKLRSEFGKIAIGIQDEKGTLHDVKINDIIIPEKDVKNYLTRAGQYILQNELPANEKSLAEVKSFAEALWIAENRTQYNTHLAKEISADSMKELRKKIHNPKANFSEQTPPNPTKKDGDDVVMEQILGR